MADIDTHAEVAPASDSVKRRAACDECRAKKLKCTGEHPHCSRCARENIPCVYSPQKQMGRPKKRSRADEDADTIHPSTKSGRYSTAAWQHDPSRAYNGHPAYPLHNSSSVDAFDAPPFESAFTPGGSLQPWLQSSSDWPGDYTYGHGRPQHSGSEPAVPGLTPDNSSSHSPPMLNLPPELHATHNASYLHSHSHSQHRDSSTTLLLDPALAGPMGGNTGPTIPAPNPAVTPSNMPNCACLSTMYLTLNTLQSQTDTSTFPLALHPLREAMQTAFSVLACDECPMRFITAIQNTQLVGTLLMSIAERFSKVLEYITSESVRASVAGEKKKFRLADLNTSTSHLHTGGLGCAAAFNLNLSPDEWRSMAKKVVKAEVHGPSSGNDCCCYLMGVLKKMEERQERWHQPDFVPPSDFPKDEFGRLVGRSEGATVGRESHDESDHEAAHSKKGDHLCLKLVGYAKKLVEGFDWT